MTVAEYIRFLRSGHDSTSNLLIQITSHAVIDDGASYPLLNAHSGIFKIAQKKHVEAGGTIYNAGIQRVTGLGEVFNDLKTGEARGTAGTLTYQMDDSDLMAEARDVDWLSDSFEVRNSTDGEDWASAEPVFEGLLLNATIKNDIISFRVSGLHKTLSESVTEEKFIGNSPGTVTGGIVFGKILELPIGVHPTLKVGSDFVYVVGSENYDLDDPAVTLYYDNAGVITSTTHTNYGTYWVTATASSGWTLNANGTPENHVYADVNGYDEGPGYASLQTAGEILAEILDIARTGDISPPTVDLILDGRTLDTASLDTVATKNDLICGIKLSGYDFEHIDPVSAFDDVTVNGTAWDWRTLFDMFANSSLCLYTINRDGSISFHYLFDAPTETPVLTLRHSDFARFDNARVVVYEDVFPSSPGTDSPDELWNTYPERVAIHEGKFLTDLTEWDKAKTDILNRFGTHDYRFHDCPIAKAVNIGDVVTFDTSIDDYLDGTKKGYVTGIDRGTKPYIDVRV